MACCSARYSKETSAEGGSETYKGCSGCNKLDSKDWLSDLPESISTTDIVEIRFKNTRKAFFRNVNNLKLEIGDVVAVEASPGHDIGIVALTGDLVYERIRKNKRFDNEEIKKVYRKSKPADVEKWEIALEREDPIMFQARRMASELGLRMKIGDVEFQGDGTKAIFYYIADDRVDFRELIKILGEKFRIRVEMKQIGARQEAGRIGGIGSCGRELCCSSWMTNFVSVTTTAARNQELSLNPQKLAGQCGKLKCCLNYEIDSYEDASKDFPSIEIQLETEEGNAYHFKTDIYKRIMWYSFDRNYAVRVTPVAVDRVKEIITMNNRGKRPLKLVDISNKEVGLAERLDYNNVVGQDSLTRFENQPKKAPKKRKKSPGNIVKDVNENDSENPSPNRNVRRDYRSIQLKKNGNNTDDKPSDNA